MEKCDCCQCKAKYEVSENKVCGRHLAYTIEMHLQMGPHTVKVERINSTLTPKDG